MNNDGVDTSLIDYIFFNEKLDRKSPRITRLEDIHSSVSDHYPVACTLHLEITENTKKIVTFPLPSKVKWDKVDKDQYKERRQRHGPDQD